MLPETEAKRKKLDTLHSLFIEGLIHPGSAMLGFFLVFQSFSERGWFLHSKAFEVSRMRRYRTMGGPTRMRSHQACNQRCGYGSKFNYQGRQVLVHVSIYQYSILGTYFDPQPCARSGVQPGPISGGTSSMCVSLASCSELNNCVAPPNQRS